MNCRQYEILDNFVLDYLQHRGLYDTWKKMRMELLSIDECVELSDDMNMSSNTFNSKLKQNNHDDSSSTIATIITMNENENQIRLKHKFIRYSIERLIDDLKLSIQQLDVNQFSDLFTYILHQYYSPINEITSIDNLSKRYLEFDKLEETILKIFISEAIAQNQRNIILLLFDNISRHLLKRREFRKKQGIINSILYPDSDSSDDWCHWALTSFAPEEQTEKMKQYLNGNFRENIFLHLHNLLKFSLSQCKIPKLYELINNYKMKLKDEYEEKYEIDLFSNILSEHRLLLTNESIQPSIQENHQIDHMSHISKFHSNRLEIDSDHFTEKDDGRNEDIRKKNLDEELRLKLSPDSNNNRIITRRNGIY
ncbi:hypothetical protein SNEBB_003914 [Seison nebaliae]|nr:hypothetical protein SNEBB_003914 [Seison nebaliae]